MKNKIFLAGIVVASLLLSNTSSAVYAEGQPKVDVCHLDDASSYHLITVAEPAYQAHFDHGDASPGDPAPGMDGYVFDADCTPESIPASLYIYINTNIGGVDFNFTSSTLGDFTITSTYPGGIGFYNLDPGVYDFAFVSDTYEGDWGMMLWACPVSVYLEPGQFFTCYITFWDIPV